MLHKDLQPVITLFLGLFLAGCSDTWTRAMRFLPLMITLKLVDKSNEESITLSGCQISFRTRMLEIRVSNSQCRSESKTCCEILVFSFSLLTQSLMEEKSSLKGWQRVRHLPDLFSRLFYFQHAGISCSPWEMSALQHLDHATLLSRTFCIQWLLSLCLFCFWLCCALLSAAALFCSAAETLTALGES